MHALTVLSAPTLIAGLGMLSVATLHHAFAQEQNQPEPVPCALDIAREKLAAGEITPEEYAYVRETLTN